MEAVRFSKTQTSSPWLPLSNKHSYSLTHPGRTSFRLERRFPRLSVANSGSSKSAAEVEKEVEEEMKQQGEEWMEMGKCSGRRGVAELLECLEKEAIMGEDTGRDARDYNRRAQIFDKSSRVFQALKERHQN